MLTAFIIALQTVRMTVWSPSGFNNADLVRRIQNQNLHRQQRPNGPMIRNAMGMVAPVSPQNANRPLLGDTVPSRTRPAEPHGSRNRAQH